MTSTIHIGCFLVDSLTYIRFLGLRIEAISSWSSQSSGWKDNCIITMRGTSSLPSLVPAGCISFGLSLAFPFVFGVMVLAKFFYCIF